MIYSRSPTVLSLIHHMQAAFFVYDSSLQTTKPYAVTFILHTENVYLMLYEESHM